MNWWINFPLNYLVESSKEYRSQELGEIRKPDIILADEPTGNLDRGKHEAGYESVKGMPGHVFTNDYHGYS